MSQAPSESRLASLPPEEVRVRIDLAAAYRLIALFGWDDLIFTHLSARVPGTPHFLINPYGMMFEEICASSLVKIDVHGEKVEDSPHDVNPAGFVIHSAVHQGRDDAHAVMHLHTTDGQAVSAQRDGLLPLNQTAMVALGQGLAYHDYEGVAVDTAERERLVRDLGDAGLMILRNHGTLSVGATVAMAFVRLYFLERACAAQTRALAGGVPLNAASPAAIEQSTGMARAGLSGSLPQLIWPALLRRLDRRSPGYER